MVTPAEKAFCEQVVQRLNQVAPVQARGMFGGYGLYCEGVMFALIAEQQLYFKVDDSNRPDYAAAAMPPFYYQRQGRSFAMSYHQLPAAVYQDTAQLAEWLDRSLAAARRQRRGRRDRVSR
jgi:DNA transformation protein and related proteins